MGAHEASTAVKGRLAFARMIGSALASQALLSAANFAVGLLLIRHTSDLAYGYYILASTAILLIVSLQSAFVNPPLVNRLTPLDRVARRELVGGLYRDQRHVLRVCGGIAFVLCALLWEAGVFDGQTGPLILATIAATLASMHRGFFRLVLLAYRRAHDVLLTDICYIVILLLGVGIALFTPAPAVAAMIAIAFAAGISGAFTTGILRRHEPWDIRGAPGILREVAPLAAWSAAGAAIHWAFSQGYMYLAAGTLDVAAVAALAATRLLMMPVNLMSAGIGT
ncbi:MAG TPA: hypothetical protein VKB34_11060, partial [Povalibacter sp.]|nr:hypothetical protein [Povalibacter sp.]